MDFPEAKQGVMGLTLSSKRFVEIITPSTSGYDLIWK